MWLRANKPRWKPLARGLTLASENKAVDDSAMLRPATVPFLDNASYVVQRNKDTTSKVKRSDSNNQIANTKRRALDRLLTQHSTTEVVTFGH